MCPQVSTSRDATEWVQVSRKPWSKPVLVQLGTVLALTSKKDTIGRNDGGTFLMKRT